MSARVFVGCASVVLVLTLLPGIQVHGQRNIELPETQQLENRVAELEKAVTELEDINSLLMENLINCMEESKELTQESGQTQVMPPPAVPPDPVLVHLLERILQTEKDLNFLLRLDQAELELLLDLVEKRVANP